jgi:DNA-directed RNA polymerase subunit RPC12/RpoP
MTSATLCVSCGRPMQLLRLAGHMGREVQVDLCGGCHLLWFDGLESVNLAGRGVLDLLRAIAGAHAQPHEPLATALACPRCRTPLRRAENFTSLGPTAQHECPRGHGAAQSFSLYLAEKGFVRPLYRPEAEQLRKRPSDRQVFECLNCGAPVDPRQREACGHCGSPLKVLDVLPLMRAVDRQTGQLPTGAQVSQGLRPRGFQCLHCGAAVDPAKHRRCPACAMPVVLTDLKRALQMMEPLAAAVERNEVTTSHRLRRLAESLDGAPKGLPPSRPSNGYRQPAWVYLSGATIMLVLGVLLVLWSRR